jgi:fatty acid desaturase
MGPSSDQSPPPTTLAPSDARTAGGAYAELFREVRSAGLMDRRRGHYLARILGSAVLFAGAVTAFVMIGDSWWQLFTAAAFAILFVQFGFIGHDAGHGQIFAGRWGNDVVGYLHGDLLIGLGYGWWVGKHNAHHANPNHEERDPDVNLGILAFTTAQSDDAGRGPVGRFIIRHQAGLFFPLLFLEGLDLHVSAVRSLVTRQVPALKLEIVLLAVHAVVYLGAIFTVLSPGKAVLFIVVQQGLFGLYLGCSFAPGHKGMPMLTATEKLDPIRRQVLTSRNIRGGPLVDIVLGGLNYQIEHHLFPRMPRPNLRRAQPMVREFCDRHAIPYTETSLFGSYARGLAHLRTVSAPARSR